MFGRRKREEAAPATPTFVWSPRIDASRSTIVAQAPNSAAVRSVEEVAARLIEAEADRERLTVALRQLDPERTGRELKDALRSAKERPGSVSDHHVGVLRERYATVNRLQDRVDELAQRIESTVIDVELLAVRTVEATALGGTTRVDDHLAEPIERLRVDVAALGAAHDELRTL